MSVKRFRTKPVEIEATRYTLSNLQEMIDWTGGQFRRLSAFTHYTYSPGITAEVYDVLHETWIGVKAGQWIVRGAKGEFYPCDDETFHWKYEEVSDTTTVTYGEHAYRVPTQPIVLEEGDTKCIPVGDYLGEEQG